MNRKELEIYVKLKANPGMMYVSPDGSKLYLLSSDDELMYLAGPDFNKMDEKQLNRFVQDYILDNRER